MASDNCISSAASSELSSKERLAAAFENVQDLRRVEQLMQSKFSSEAPLLQQIPEYLLSIGGKRLRPALALICARLAGMKSASAELVDVSAGIELIHMATLLHDDIIDNSPRRRHHNSPLFQFGIPSTLLAGDFLLVRAFALCSRLDSFIVNATEKACISLTEGEILETPLFECRHDYASAINISRKKTAALFSLAALCGAYLSGMKESAVAHMTVFGEKLGIAFQILDDILDVASKEELLGKQLGIDLRERKPSTVNVLWLESGSELALQLLEKPEKDQSEFIDKALLELRSSLVLEEARAKAREFIDAARKSLDQALPEIENPDPESLSAIEAILDYTLDRLE